MLAYQGPSVQGICTHDLLARGRQDLWSVVDLAGPGASRLVFTGVSMELHGQVSNFLDLAAPVL